MDKKPKNLISSYFISKRVFWSGTILFFIILGLFFPLSYAQSQFFPILPPIGFGWGPGLLGAIKGAAGIAGGIAGAIAGAIATIIMSLILALSIVLLDFARMVLGWAVDPFFLISSYTSGGVVDVGWPVVRDLSNMFIVLVLVFIGLATALRLKEYQAQKTLPRLIGVALLINFTPVILGVIVDGANITMNFFLSGLSGTESLATRFKSIGQTIANTLQNIGSFDALANLELTFKVIIMTAYNVFASIIFLLFALLFIIRRVAIWILVILSPLAFVAYILPATRGFFTFWWHQFWQWTIIGVSAAFFLWLGDHMIEIAARESGQGFLNEVLPFGVALVFLLIGFFVALSTSAMGASGIIAGGQKFGKAVAPWTRRQARDRAESWGRSKWEESERAKGIREFATERLSGIKTPEFKWGRKESRWNPIGWAKRGAGVAVGGTTTATWAGARATGRAIGPGFMEAQRKRAAEAEKEMQGMEVDTILSKLRAAPDWATKIGYTNRLAKDPYDFDEAIDKGLTFEEIANTMKEAEKYQLHKEMKAAVPFLLESEIRVGAGLPVPPPDSPPGTPLPPLTPPQQQILVKAYHKEILVKTRPDRAGYISNRLYATTGADYEGVPGTKRFQHPELMESIVKNWTGDRIGNFLKWRQRAGAEALENRIKQLAYDQLTDEEKEKAKGEKISNAEFWLKENNPALLRYMHQSGGRGYFTI
ncbi:hypothetical protein IH779_00370 [Patescibacteria group bacterium]|nr:hypothetical protein [Patescibacteria group bacterium]